MLLNISVTTWSWCWSLLQFCYSFLYLSLLCLATITSKRPTSVPLSNFGTGILDIHPMTMLSIDKAFIAIVHFNNDNAVNHFFHFFSQWSLSSLYLTPFDSTLFFYSTQLDLTRLYSTILYSTLLHSNLNMS